MKAEAATYAGLAIGLAVLVACAGAPVTTPAVVEQPMAGVAQVAPPAAPAQAPAAPTTPARLAGFLTAETMPNAVATIPPAPKEDEARNDLDWKIFRDTRAMEGSERWKLAQADDNYRPSALLEDFSCSIGAKLTPENVPTLAAILGRTTIDAGMAAEAAKQLYRRTRPYLHNAGNICITKSDGLAASFDYPSGHGSLGWMSGLVIAQLAPDQASEILARGRAYGESRVVCGVHNMSAIEAARTNAAGVFAALQGSPEFLAAMVKAREEIDAARKTATKPDVAWCTKEAELIKPLVLN